MHSKSKEEVTNTDTNNYDLLLCTKMVSQQILLSTSEAAHAVT